MDNEVRILAAQYLRKSTEHQQYSLENQAAAVQDYAAKNGFLIIQTYSDSSTGLLFKNRKGLRRLVDEVTSGRAEFKAILVYDISRWGRFLDADESAYYEFICKSAGIQVHYCGETFPNDGTLVSLLLKSMKRIMAGEYSRELSVKCLAGLRRIARLGFRCGGVPVYGLRRLLVSKNGEAKQELEYGQRKSVQEDRIKLVPGPEEEVNCVREIYRMFLQDHKNPREIADELNLRGVPYPGNGRQDWYAEMVRRMLQNSNYCGSYVYGKTSQKFKSTPKRLPEGSWITVPGAWKPIISAETFKEAQLRLQAHARYKSDAELLDHLREAAGRVGSLRASILIPLVGDGSIDMYRFRFGSYSEALAAAGLGTGRLAYTLTHRNKARLRTELMNEVVRLSNQRVSIVRSSLRRRPLLKLRNGIFVTVYVCPAKTADGKLGGWFLRRPPNDRDRITLVALLDSSNQCFQEFHLLSELPWSTAWSIVLDDPLLRAGTQLESLCDFEASVRLMRQERSKK